jgi:hypothetical protein
MGDGAGVFVMKSADSLIGLQPAQFAQEKDFQVLLERFPELLVGSQIDPESPRRWVLVRREQPVSTGEVDASQWSVDHVFLDQDGIPTLVEVKRQSDSRLRREVVGQMLDYAASCATYWTADKLQSALETTCEKNGQPVEKAMEHLLGADPDIEGFWEKVKANLLAGKVRLLFVADWIPLELRRVVEFLNKQMEPAEVLAIELRQFEGAGLKTIVPTVYGHVQQGAKARASIGPAWNRESLLDKLRTNVGAAEVTIADRLIDWMAKDGTRGLVFGRGKENGTVYPFIAVHGVRVTPMYLSSDGKIWFQFRILENRPVFSQLEKRRELIRRLNEIAGITFSDDDLQKDRGIPLAIVASDPEGEKKLFAALTWMEQQLEKLDGNVGVVPSIG